LLRAENARNEVRDLHKLKRFNFENCVQENTSFTGSPFAQVKERESYLKDMRTMLDFKILPQPTETTCGPTCLHGVYQFFEDDVSLPSIIEDIRHLEDGGTLAVNLGCDALKRGYRAKIYTYNVDTFDPTWFQEPASELPKFVEAQKRAKKNKKLHLASDAYLEYLRLGGEILFEDLTPRLLRRYLEKGVPILTGLSATYLYKSAREIGATNLSDSVAGEPAGHFVVIAGIDREKKCLLVADPFHANPFATGNYYWVEIHRVISSILLGILTYDANLLIIEPGQKKTTQ
jgi:hypothetical protein